MSTKELVRRSRQLPSVWDDFFKPWNNWFSDDYFPSKMITIPAANITETKDQFQLTLAAPGLKKSDFNIDIEGNVLTISSEKEENKEEKDSHHTRKEYNYQSFSRTFTLPDEVAKEKIEARYDDGILKLTLPKKEEAKKSTISKHVEVK